MKEKKSTQKLSSVKEFLVFKSSDGDVRIDVRVENETVWLTQKLIAALYEVSVPTINEHLKNIYADHEINQYSTIRNFRIVQKEGDRTVSREVDHYNLDAIIAVGYRISSHRATQFRQWATEQLRTHDHARLGNEVKCIFAIQ